MRRKSAVLLSGVFLLAVLVVSLFGCYQGWPKELAPTVNELKEYMAQAIIDDQLAHSSRSLEGTFVAHVTESGLQDESVSPLRIWKYEQGHLVDGELDAFRRAMSSKQPSDWPPFVFLFVFKSVTPDSAAIDVHTYYDMGLMPDSRGGNAAIWELEKQQGRWTVVSKEPYLFWD